MRIPSAEELATHCLSGHYRRCDVFRRYLVALSERPERWRSAVTTYGTTASPPRRLRGE
jgi:hypothetical protein